jgi:alkylation response protein AidB-like acyl-CoA dehydrogenase
MTDAPHTRVTAAARSWSGRFRDVRAAEIYQATSEAQRLIIAESVLAAR